MSDLSPTALQPILAHLLHWGELSSAEARRLGAEAGLVLLAIGGLVQDAPDAWLIGPTLERLLPGTNPEEVWQKACWSLPAYQAYVTGLAAGEIARRGLEGAGELVETWVVQQLPHRALDFNAFLDAVEDDLSTPLIESTPGTIVQATQHRLQKMEKDIGMDFAAWNQALLGVSAPTEAVFQAALARGVLAELLEAITPTTAVPAPILDLNTELAQSSRRWVLCPILEYPNPLQHPTLVEDPAWQTRRYVFSSVPLLVDASDEKKLTPEKVQVAFCQHPLSWIIIQFGLYAQIQANSGAGEMLRLALERNEDGMLCDLRIDLPGGAVRRLSEALPTLLAGLGFNMLLPFGEISSVALGAWLDALLQADILETRGDSVTLCEDFSRLAFESKYYQTLIKTSKSWRVRLVEILGGGIL